MTAEIFAPPHVKDVALTRLKDAHARYQRGEINGREEAGVALLVVRAIAAMALGIERTRSPPGALERAARCIEPAGRRRDAEICSGRPRRRAPRPPRKVKLA